MALIKGSISLTRYRVLDQPADISPEIISDRLKSQACYDIDNTTDEESFGWVEVLDPISSDFPETSFLFGGARVMGLRVDTRRLPSKVLNRYLAMAEAEAEENGPLSANQRRELKNSVRQELLARTPVSTDVHEAVWFPKEEEVWLAASGKKVREQFEELWRRTFQSGLYMKIPFVLAREVLPAEVSAEDLERARASALWGR